MLKSNAYKNQIIGSTNNDHTSLEWIIDSNEGWIPRCEIFDAREGQWFWAFTREPERIERLLKEEAELYPDNSDTIWVSFNDMRRAGACTYGIFGYVQMYMPEIYNDLVEHESAREVKFQIPYGDVREWIDPFEVEYESETRPTLLGDVWP